MYFFPGILEGFLRILRNSGGVSAKGEGKVVGVQRRRRNVRSDSFSLLLPDGGEGVAEKGSRIGGASMRQRRQDAPALLAAAAKV